MTQHGNSAGGELYQLSHSASQKTESNSYAVFVVGEGVGTVGLPAKCHLNERKDGWMDGRTISGGSRGVGVSPVHRF